MKHLLSALSTRTIPLDAQEDELRTLLSQAHRLRGDTKSGETWEETLEKVLVELRALEYATAFLKPVKKSEAWDYDKVISHPMDLQTMGRKIKQHSYMSKKAFADDLNLIWENCLTYNSDPNHPLRRAAQFMRKKSDQILRRIPDRHERFAPGMIDRFKYALPPSPGAKLAAPNGVSSVKKENRIPNGVPKLERTASSSSVVPMAVDEGTEAKTFIRVGRSDALFEDRPALERTGEGMAAFASLDQEMSDFLSLWDPSSIPTGHPRSSSNLMTNGTARLDVNQRLEQLVQEDEELAVWKVVNDDHEDEHSSDAMSTDEVVTKRSESPDPLSSEGKKRKRPEGAHAPRKRSRLERLSEPDRTPLENWWFAMGSTDMLANAIPASSQSAPIPNPLYVKRQARIARANSPSAMATDGASPSKGNRQKSREPSQKPTLFRLMFENIRMRKRARDIAIRITDQIEDEKQGIDPDDMAPLIPLEEPLPAVTRPWARRAGLSQRRRREVLEDDISAAEAQDCMETMSMLVLEHANFDSSSVSALRVLGDLAGRCIQNLGKTLKSLHETHQGKMTSEEMVLHALFSNSIGSIHELEAYIKGDIIKHGNSLSTMLTTLEEVATKRDEPVDEEAMLKDENEVMTGLGDLGEDIYGFREMGLDTEFGLKSLVVPKRLLRPRAKVIADERGLADEADKYPAPPPFVPLETKRIDDQIGLLRAYYHQRVLTAAPPPRIPTPPPPVAPPTPAVAIKAPSPEPEPPIPKEPTPPPAPTPAFDPYNPSALSISVPKSTSTPSIPPPAPPPATPSALPQPPTPLVDIGSTDIVIPDNLVLLNTLNSNPLADVRVASPVIELPPILDDDDPDPSRVKVGPLGQIHIPSAATVAKQKRQNKAAAQAKAAAAATASLSAQGAALKLKKVSPKKPKKSEATPAPTTAT